MGAVGAVGGASRTGNDGRCEVRAARAMMGGASRTGDNGSCEVKV